MKGVRTVFTKILLPVDMSDIHAKAIDTAAELIRQSEGEVVLLHVIEVITGVPMEDERSFYNRLERAADGHLRKLGKQLEEQKVRWRMEILYGNRPREIVRYASEMRADLILLTAPRPQPANPLVGWGSLSYRIGMLSPCPVLIVK